MADTTELVPELLEAGVHFGHQTKRWNPKMKPYIFEKRNPIYIINLDETVKQLQRATEFLQEVTRRGGKILFVGCKKQAQEAVKEAAAGLRTILRQPTLARRNVDESGHHSQEHRALEIHRGNREIARVQENGQTGARGAESRSRQTAPQPRRHSGNGATARRARHHRHDPRTERGQRSAPARYPDGGDSRYQRRSRR